MTTTRMTKFALLVALTLSVPFALTACAYSTEAPPSSEENSELSEDELAQAEREYQEEHFKEHIDLNSVVRYGTNGVTTLTVTLNNGKVVECIDYGELRCFPELSDPR